MSSVSLFLDEIGQENRSFSLATSFAEVRIVVDMHSSDNNRCTFKKGEQLAPIQNGPSSLATA